MLFIYFDRVKDWSSAEHCTDNLSSEVMAKISRTANRSLKNERISAYTLLTRAISEKNACEADIIFSETGKPLVKSKKIDISLSHTKNGVAAAIYQGSGSVGIDIEEISEKNEERAERFLKRYGLSDLSLKKMDSGKIIIDSECNIIPDNFEGCGYLRSWTLTEALLKCRGGGFSSLPDIDLLKNGCEACSMKIRLYERDFIFSVVVLSEK